MRPFLIIALIIWTAIITWSLLSPSAAYNTPNSAVRRGAETVKKVTATSRTLTPSLCLHAVYFGLQAALFACLLARWGKTIATATLLAGAATFGYGLALEFVQENFVPGRAFEGKDLAANGAGIGLGLLLAATSAFAWRRCGRPHANA